MTATTETMLDADLERFVPRVTAEWDLDAPGRAWQQVDGTLCFVDISGFTNLSEKLARRGRIGAEELTEVLDRVFGAMLRLAYDRGGSLLKFGGDALLLMFEGERHPIQAACAAVEMRAALRDATRIPTSVGRIALRMSVGVHTGPIDLYRVGGSHDELVITGDTATVTTAMEGAADAGEILVSPALAERLPRSAAGNAEGPGVLLRWRTPKADPVGPVARRAIPADVIARAVPEALRHHLGRGGGESEHRIGTVGFVKFAGVTDTMAAGGHDAVAAALAELVTTTQAAVDAEAVTFLATDVDADGGKIILTTGVPSTQEDDEGRLLRAVRVIADAGTALPLKIGVNRGHVFAGQIGTDFRSTYTVMGDTVNLAARLMAAAPPGGVYATPAVLARSRTLFETEVLEPFRVKGKDEPVQAYAVGAEVGQRENDTTHELPFTGRDAELAELREAMASLASGAGSAWTVVGDTGVGKTRLVSEAVAGLDPGSVLMVRAEPYGADNPYWAFRDPLRRLLGIERDTQAAMAARLEEVVGGLAPSLAPWLSLIGDVAHIDVPDTPESAAIEPRFRPERTAGAIVDLLEAAANGQLALVVEDGHWIDEASAALVTRLAAAATNRPWVVLVTTRPEREHLPDALGTEIALGPLDDEAARDIVIAATASAPLRPHEQEAVVGRAAGNPLFLEEILRLVRETGSLEALPDSLDAVVGAEIDALRPLSRRLLRYSSVLGRSFRRVVLEELLAPEDGELDSATLREVSRFLEPDGTSRIRFRHAVVQDVAYQGLSYRKRRELHRRAGEVIERLAGEDPEAVAEFLALHFAEAGVPEKAWHYGRVAGDKAKTSFANIEADGHYRRALEAARRMKDRDDHALLEVWRSVAEVREQAGLFDESLAALRRARALAEDEVERAELHSFAARSRLRIGDFAAALRETSVGSKLVVEQKQTAARRTRAQLLVTRAWVKVQQGKPQEAIDLARQAQADALASNEEDALARTYSVLDMAFEMVGEPDRATNEPRALRIYERLGDRLGVANTANNLGVRDYAIGDWNQAVAHYQRAIAEFRAVGNETAAATAAANLGEVLVSQQRFDEATTLLEEAVRALRASDSNDFAVFAEAQLARVGVARGDALPSAEQLRSLVGEAFDIGHSGIALDTTVHLATALLAAGLPDEAATAIEEAEARAGGEAAYFEVPLSRLRAQVALAGGNLEEALAGLELALTMAREQDMPYEAALTLRVRASVPGGSTPNADVEEADRRNHVLGVVSAT